MVEKDKFESEDEEETIRMEEDEEVTWRMEKEEGKTEVASDATREVLFAGRYRLEELLGSGAAGRVYRAYDVVLEMPVALKVLASEEFATEMEVERFLSDARAAAKLARPNIVRVYNAGHDDAAYRAGVQRRLEWAVGRRGRKRTR